MLKWTMLVGAALLVLPGTLAAQTYPAKGRTITMIVPSSAGGGSDTAARIVAPVMEKDLGVPVEIVNKPGASMQIGVSAALSAKPDGYTLYWSILPTQVSIYLDPERQAPFGRKDFQVIGNVYGAPFGLVVAANSPYKTVQDLVAAAKAKPKGIKGGTTGFLSTGHFANLEFQRGAGVDLATVNFEGGGPQLTALLGGHIDVGFNSIGELLTQHKSGAVRVIAVMDDVRSDLLPDVPTLKELGVTAKPIGSYVGLAGSAGIPKPIVEVLTKSLKKATEDPVVNQKMVTLGNTIQYMDPQQYNKFWSDFEENLKPLIKMAKEQAK